jgi:hypothetical protein
MSTFFGFFDRPISPRDRRQSCRYQGSENRIFLGWWEGPEFRTTTAVMKDVSVGGALILVDTPTPQDKLVWISLYKVPPTEWIEASVVEASRLARGGLFRRGLSELRVKFLEPCRYDYFKFFKAEVEA